MKEVKKDVKETKKTVKKSQANQPSMSDVASKALLDAYSQGKSELVNYAVGSGVKPRARRLTMKTLKEGGALYKADDMNKRMPEGHPLQSYEPHSQGKKGGAVKCAKGSPEMKAKMAKLRAMRKK
jgi:hypothetical protein